ncbi:axin-1-like protein [Sarcoptes scabiei]|uniref:Axin-1-like protein n=1 Tax=Sarcoptes scabiei TaxID=52283 RepID=A0A132A5R0_SARSC|nr:axin-1-like protein [Sarcoptes scabiei]
MFQQQSTSNNNNNENLSRFLQTSESISSPRSNVTTPPVDRWSRDFDSLINDGDGVTLFKQYLDEMDLNPMYGFYFAVQGMKKTNNLRLIVIIFKRFILKANLLPLSEQCRQNLLEAYKSIKLKEPEKQSTVGMDIFDEAFTEIKDQLGGAIYENFLKSRIFIDYVNGLENETQPSNRLDSNDQTNQYSNESDDQDIGLEYSGSKFIMPTIDETSEDNDSTVIEVSKYHSRSQPFHRNHSINRFGNVMNNRDDDVTFKEYSFEKLEKINCLDAPPNPYHVNRHVPYSTVQYNSKKDSEIESISSSDSSFVHGHSRNEKKSTLRLVGRTIGMNSGTLPNKTLAQRSQKQIQTQQTKNQLLPTSNPDEFARRLIEKLQKVFREQETNIKLRQVMAELNVCDRDRPHSPGAIANNNSSNVVNCQQREAGVGSDSHTLTKSSGQVKSNLGQALKKIDWPVSIESESCQSILDKHFAQVFDTPNADSPTTSNQSTSAYHQNVVIGQPLHYLGSSSDGINSNSLPPPSPLSPKFSAHISKSFSHQTPNLTNANAQPLSNTALAATNTVFIPVTVKFSTEEVPFKLKLPGPNITLLAFKQQIPQFYFKRGISQFYFKRLCTDIERQEIDAAHVLEQISDDNAFLPQCDGKIYALIEMSN